MISGNSESYSSRENYGRGVSENLFKWIIVSVFGLATTFGWDRLLDNVMAYWATNTAASAARLYRTQA